MKRYDLFLDDERDPPDDDDREWVVVRSMEAACSHVTLMGCPALISFDHDLGDGPTGYDFAKWLVDQFIDGLEIPHGFACRTHSQNPVGAENIRGLIQSYLKFSGKPPITFVQIVYSQDEESMNRDLVELGMKHKGESDV